MYGCSFTDLAAFNDTKKKIWNGGASYICGYVHSYDSQLLHALFICHYGLRT